MAKRRIELDGVVENIKNMRYVNKLSEAIWQMVEDTAEEMAEDDKVDCDSKEMLEMAIEEIIFNWNYTNKQIDTRLEWAEED